MVDTAGRITSFTVDGSGNLTKKVCPELCTMQFRYDGSHQMTASIDATGVRYSYAYDTVRRITRVTQPDNTRKTYSWLDWTHAQVVDAAGSRTTLLLNVAKNITAVVNPLSQRATSSWQSNLRTYVQDGNGNRTTFTYRTGANRTTQPLAVIKPLSGRTTYLYLCSCQLRAWDYSDYSEKLAVVVWVAPQLARNPFVWMHASSAVMMPGDCRFGLAPCADQSSLPLPMAA